MFSSPLSGTFFQFEHTKANDAVGIAVFVPSLGNFFQSSEVSVYIGRIRSFRPLSRGLFFNEFGECLTMLYVSFSSPLSGTFFQ